MPGEVVLGSSVLGVSQAVEWNGQVPTEVLPISSAIFRPLPDPPITNGQTEAKVTAG